MDTIEPPGPFGTMLQEPWHLWQGPAHIVKPDGTIQVNHGEMCTYESCKAACTWESFEYRGAKLKTKANYATPQVLQARIAYLQNFLRHNMRDVLIKSRAFYIKFTLHLYFGIDFFWSWCFLTKFRINNIRWNKTSQNVPRVVMFTSKSLFVFRRCLFNGG